jgi:hypothetical protein
MAEPTPKAQRFAASCLLLVVAGAAATGATAHAQLSGSVDAVTERINQASQIQERAAQAEIDQERQVHVAAARGSGAARDEQVKLVEAERVAQNARDQFRSTYQRALDDLKAKTDAGQLFYQTLFTCLAIAGIVFALLSSISGFVKWSLVAGICGLLTTAVLTAPNVFSIRENLGFYTQISSQTYALQLEASLLEHPTQSDVDRWKGRFLKLAELLANPPSVKDPDQLTKSIVQGV